ncbi:hypothetical protein ASPZODRAFT_681197 [Penicilliopsis zonata CBS 506.65]|uniref:Uncharacterized protein n=1 Tax=Penicilliopsis zonata CBS 506.65 TaxID=1073090 RepID=A0A1L9SBG5_9EURO|nr:hypothetical protein ASPZODRAFT_681197 [Penicilliopsis zonata CBS 506.65]OJJ44504.1 hypothetical protein ASPZODRAFT_681197 [Penicilliopsis zonata CBS 506.65]
METLQSPQAIQQWLRSLFPHNQPSWVASAIDSLWQFSYQSGIFQKEAPPGRGREPNVILLKAWKMAMLVVALTNLIYIPSDAGASITQHLQWGPTHNASDRISSRLTNKIIKFVLLAHYGRLVDEVLEGLDYLLRNQGQWKHAFGVTLLCVLVSGRMQEAQTDNMLVARRHGEDIRATTRAAVQELEQGITTVTNLFHLKYRTVRGASSAQNPFRPGSTLVKEDPHLQALIQQIEGARRQWSPSR